MPAELGGSQISSLLEALPGIASVLRSPVADALIKAMRGAAGLADFAPEDAEELVRYAVRRGLIGPDEGDRVLAERLEQNSRGRCHFLRRRALLLGRRRYLLGARGVGDGAAHDRLGLRAELLGDAAILLRRTRDAGGRVFDLLHRRDDFRETAGRAFGDRFDAAHLRLTDRHRRGHFFDLFPDHARGARDIFGGA